jgi:hypothetical protein
MPSNALTMLLNMEEQTLPNITSIYCCVSFLLCKDWRGLSTMSSEIKNCYFHMFSTRMDIISFVYLKAFASWLWIIVRVIFTYWIDSMQHWSQRPGTIKMAVVIAALSTFYCWQCYFFFQILSHQQDLSWDCLWWRLIV